jgi:CBS-domain-containing membrane protein
MLKSISVGDCMVCHPLTFRADTDLLLAIEQLLAHRVAAAPVVDEHGQLLGLLCEGDCLRGILAATYHDAVGGSVASYMSTAVETVSAQADLSEVTERFVRGGHHCFPVLENGRLVGLVSRHEVLLGLKAFAQHAARGPRKG